MPGLKAPEVDLSRKDESPPIVSYFGVDAHCGMKNREVNTILKKLWQHSNSRYAFDIFDRVVCFEDESDRDNYFQATGSRRAYTQTLATFTQLLEAVKSNPERGMLFAIGEEAGWTGYQPLDSQFPDHRLGHLWAGMLVKKQGPNTDEWCLNIYCTGLKEPASKFLAKFSGRRKLWRALYGAGINVTTVNRARVCKVYKESTCVINSLYWLYKASRLEGDYWKPNDKRLEDLFLSQHLASGQNLYETISLTDSEASSSWDASTDDFRVVIG
ncbi:unnamed protein product [Periconia digitata]|uniref:Uncharacterized protein n=1 Tax=Periconia digitata TaxID=1303443 RepID=A0A9W4XS73_9PLEO|nr:unnamed protein product [Periconia digitata]